MRNRKRDRSVMAMAFFSKLLRGKSILNPGVSPEMGSAQEK
jgi:hypothetical protein